MEKIQYTGVTITLDKEGKQLKKLSVYTTDMVFADKLFRIGMFHGFRVNRVHRSYEPQVGDIQLKDNEFLLYSSWSEKDGLNLCYVGPGLGLGLLDFRKQDMDFVPNRVFRQEVLDALSGFIE